MISNVYYDEGSHTLSIVWNSDGGSKTTEINLSGLVDVITVDSALSATSTNPVQNKVVTEALAEKLSRAEAEAGFTEWRFAGADSDFIFSQPFWVQAGTKWGITFIYLGSVHGPYYSESGTPQDVQVEIGLEAYGSVTATRTRLPAMADIPTKTSDLTNDGSDGEHPFISQHQQLTPIYSQTPTFSEWTCNPATSAGSPITIVENPAGTFTPYRNGVPCGEPKTLSDSVTSIKWIGISEWGDGDSPDLIATRVRTNIVGYTLGDQDDKPLASANALSAKQDRLSDPQIFAINSVVTERQTVVTFANDEVRHYDISGDLTQTNRQGWETDAGSVVKEVKIGGSVMSIVGGAFSACHSLMSVTIGNGVTNIEGGAFSNCTNLTGVTIPDSVTSIGEGAFYNCTGLMSVTIGNGVTSIGNYAFEDCTSLANITVVGKTQAQAEALLANASVSPSIITTWNDASQEWVKDQNYLTEHQSLENYYAKNETSSAAEISGVLAGKQPSGDYATSAYVNDQIQLSVHHYNAGYGIVIEPYFNPLEMPGPASQTIHRVKIDEDYTATKSYVNEGHGYTFDEPLQVTDHGPAGKSVHLDFQPSDYYAKGLFDPCLSAVRQYNSPEEVPLSAIVNAIWCLSKLQQWAAE